MKNKGKVDVIFNGQAFGNTAQRLLASGFNVNALRPWINERGECFVNMGGQSVRVNAATLRKDEWKHYDEAIIKVAEDRLIGIADLISAGLTYTIPNGMGSTVLEYEDMSDFEAADLSMDGATRGQKDRPQFDIKYLPLPIIHKDFMINTRVLNASRTKGQPLDTTNAELASRKVAEKLEDILFNGASTYTYGGGTIYGYTDYTSRNTYTLSAHWDDSAATGETVLEDVLGMKQKLINAGFYGPYVLYIPTNFETALDEDFKSGSDKSVRQRLLEISSLRDIKVADKLTADEVVLVQMTSDVVRLVQGMPVAPVEWQTEGGMINHYKVMTIQVPQIRSDQSGNCGICHGSK